jgi:hypothetical protein
MKMLSRATPLLLGLLGAASLPAVAADYGELVSLAKEWRQFVPAEVKNCVPDYSAAALAKKARGLKDFQARLAALETAGWSKSETIDYQLVKAEMNGLDFDLRVLKPWARDPTFYASVWGEQSDVPEHEGPSIDPIVDLENYHYPLSKADQKKLTCLLGAVPTVLQQAKNNLRDSNAHDLWAYGPRAFRGQSKTLADLEAGTSSMRTLEGPVNGNLKGADRKLIAAVKAAREATDSFRAWLEATADSKTGPSGVGKENYDWYMKNVHLVPYTWEQQVTLLRRELERSRASLALEEFHNRNLPPLDRFTDPEAYQAMAQERMQKLTDFLIDGGLVEDKPYYRDAMKQQVGKLPPADVHNFFAESAARDPLPLDSHSYHWIELARRKHEPHASFIRSSTPLFDIFDSRSEGLATAMEEVLMHAGLYDDSPRGREIVWILLANRAARGLASLYVQSNDMTLKQAGEFHGHWTPRKWSDPESDLVAFEQLLYLRQPGYGSSYITGKMQLDRLLSDYSHRVESEGKAFSLPEFFKYMNAAGIVPFPPIEEEMVTSPQDVGDPAAKTTP